MLQSIPGSYQSFTRGLDTTDKLKRIKSNELCALIIQEEKCQIKEREYYIVECQAFVMKGNQYHQKVQDNRSNGRNWKYDDKNIS